MSAPASFSTLYAAFKGDTSVRKQIVTTPEKEFIKAYLEQFNPAKPEPIKKEMSRIIEMIQMCSMFHISSKKIEQLVLYLVSLIDPMRLVYIKDYRNPEIIPQQYFLQIKENLPSEKVIGSMHRQSVAVIFLVDQVVGFRFQDGTSWTSGNRIKV